MVLCILIYIGVRYSHRNYLQFPEGDIYQRRCEMSTYQKCIQYYGTPIKEMEGYVPDRPELGYWLLYYDGFVVTYEYCENNSGGRSIGRMYSAMFYTDDYSFGEKNVTVGMSRKQIEKIFKYSQKDTLPEKDGCYVCDENGRGEWKSLCVYFDDCYEESIGFMYDENDCVSKIFLMDGIY